MENSTQPVPTAVGIALVVLLVAANAFFVAAEFALVGAQFVPRTKEVEDILVDMKRLKVHPAVVLDEYGGTAGLVTMEDLLEEITGCRSSARLSRRAAWSSRSSRCPRVAWLR